ncbi:TPA: DUF2975 domain-containing protein [Aeromonas hydrophila]|uniref:DUF2975 domain-containing protein n=1 Tax=Aeromonas hydrophila TaxID=644 RepID=A0ABD7G9D0_AERHY|nr:DUF2975 domain-containing protein [Aeromonas hydrophila]MBC8672012.1 DUF2975 domain-containing protein [Aeromonas hydrophila]MBC8689693.1 DUF2975 domain-containing protein [Aeromonas hydrophila]PKD25263.1 putative membrane protein [Aeromonas hydrophila]RCF50491.1 DUF2975 domain-containing protein [Aeromonas hydrophila]WRK90695.1 DUF2975 domain-containing protein [Aeromonas hydrophila]
MKHNKLERMSNLIEWILLFALLATPIMTVMGVWSQLLGGSDYLQQELIEALAVQDSSTLNNVPLTMAQPALASIAPSIADYPLSLGTRLLGTLVMLLPDLVFMLMLWQLLQLFRGYRQAMLFTFSQIRRYQLIGLLLCVSFVTKIITTPLLDLVLTLPGPELHGQINIGSSDFQLLLAGLIVSALALVMREAKRLADEQQLTV